ncbi:MAG: hypothetical protein M5U34_38365 [Chloroflexi bacterium]|nr:hypothetical protein [Chloroflexota bacterium]
MNQTQTFHYQYPLANRHLNGKELQSCLRAIAGEGDSGGYSFIIEATKDEIQSFYENELSNAGWEFLATGEGETGAIFMVFQRVMKQLPYQLFLSMATSCMS